MVPDLRFGAGPGGSVKALTIKDIKYRKHELTSWCEVACPESIVRYARVIF